MTRHPGERRKNMDGGCKKLMILKGSELTSIPEIERQTNLFVTIPVCLGKSSHVFSASEVIFTAGSDQSEPSPSGRKPETEKHSGMHMIATCAVPVNHGNILKANPFPIFRRRPSRTEVRKKEGEEIGCRPIGIVNGLPVKTGAKLI